MPDYGTVARVEGFVGDLVGSRTFSGSTTPTLTEVTQFLDDVSAQVNVELLVAGYTAPVATADDPETKAYLDFVVSAGAAALALQTSPGFSWTEPGGEGSAFNRLNALQNHLSHALKLIREHKLPAASSAPRFGKLKVGSDTVALFKVHQFDYPGSRTDADTDS